MKKDFDCVEMKRIGQEALRKRLEGMSEDQILAFWAEQTQKLRDEQATADANAASMLPIRKSA